MERRRSKAKTRRPLDIEASIAALLKYCPVELSLKSSRAFMSGSTILYGTARLITALHSSPMTSPRRSLIHEYSRSRGLCNNKIA